MKKVKSIGLVAVTLFTMSTPSVEAMSLLRLAPGLQKVYCSWDQNSGKNVLPQIEYKYEDAIYRAPFFSREDRYNTTVQIPTDLLEFDIYLPSTVLGAYIKFTFSSKTCNFPPPNFSHLDKETLSKIFRPSSKSFISEGLYHIDIKYIFNAGKPTCAQCILIPTFQTENPPLVSISDIP